MTFIGTQFYRSMYLENEDDKNEILGDSKYLNKVKVEKRRRPALGLRQGQSPEFNFFLFEWLYAQVHPQLYFAYLVPI